MQIGIDRLSREEALLSELKTRRVGLLSHPAAVDRKLDHVSTVLDRLGVRPVIVFGPEHGYGGEAQDMVGVAEARDPRSGARIVSLYGDSFDDLSPKPADLAELDVLLIDLADIGSRYYTFVWTALLALRSAFAANKEVILLDRPNPLGGEQAEGKLVEDGFQSFVGLESVPVRHALTVGEMVSLFADRASMPPEALRVLGVREWNRSELANTWDRPFVMTSPNMPTLETALVYPGGCLIEGTNLSEGRGTTRPFELVGAPFVDGARLARDLMASGLSGFVARPVTFQPTFQKHVGQICGGVQLHVTDPKLFRPYATYLALVAHCQRQAPEAFRFRTERYEYVDHIPAFDLLTGSARAREQILAGAALDTWLAAEAEPPLAWTEQLLEATSRAVKREAGQRVR